MNVFTRSFYYLDLNCLVSTDIIRDNQKAEVLITGNDSKTTGNKHIWRNNTTQRNMSESIRLVLLTGIDTKQKLNMP